MRKALILLLFGVLGGAQDVTVIKRRVVAASGGTPTLVASAAKASTNATSVTTNAANFIGSTLLVIHVANNGSETPTVTPTQTVTCLTLYSNGRLCYVSNPTGDLSALTVSLTGGYPSLSVAGFSNVSTYDGAQVGAHNATNTTTIQPGSYTPTTSHLIITGTTFYNTTTAPTVDSGFTRATYALSIASNAFGSGLAYLVAPSTTALNPTWTVNSSWSGETAEIAGFH